MDRSTHAVRRANRLNIVNKCQERPANISMRIDTVKSFKDKD